MPGHRPRPRSKTPPRPQRHGRTSKKSLFSYIVSIKINTLKRSSRGSDPARRPFLTPGDPARPGRGLGHPPPPPSTRHRWIVALKLPSIVPGRYAWIALLAAWFDAARWPACQRYPDRAHPSMAQKTRLTKDGRGAFCGSSGSGEPVVGLDFHSLRGWFGPAWLCPSRDSGYRIERTSRYALHIYQRSLWVNVE